MRRELLRLVRSGQAEIYAALIVDFLGSVEIKFCKRNFLGSLWGKNPQRLADDSVILHFLFALIAENQNCGWCCLRGLRAFRAGRSLRGRARIDLSLIHI